MNIEEFASLLEAEVVVEAWRIEYNTYRPHGALHWRTPAHTLTVIRDNVPLAHS